MHNMHLMPRLLLVLGGLAAATPALAAPTVFFGEDINSLGDPNTLAAVPNSDAARAAFLSQLSGVQTESFEGIAVGVANPVLNFGPAGTAALSGSGRVQAGNDGAGRYPISINNYYYAGTDDFSIVFSQPVSAFGFYGIDIGDFGGQLTLLLTAVGGATTLLSVGNIIGNGGDISGSVLYFGFVDPATVFTSLSFGNNSGGLDVFGFDNMTIGVPEQLNVPEPWTLGLLGSGLLGLGMVRRRAGPAPRLG